MTESLVKEYYSDSVRKGWNRLVKNPYHQLELETTLYFLEKYLPANGLVLDAGGGPGRYTFELAKRGYDVILMDLTPANLAFARNQIKRTGCRQNVKDVIEGSIIDLARFDDHTFDAVLCTGGPLPHILEKDKRTKAIAELVRVAKPGAPIFVSVIRRLSVLIVELKLAPFEIELPHFQPMRDSGDYFGGSGFTACHFFLPEELHEDFYQEPVEILEMVGLEGISSHHPKELNRLARNEQCLAIWKQTHYQTCTHPAIVGTSEHMLIIDRKR
jgi:SAM-dependent methyltransferase